MAKRAKPLRDKTKEELEPFIGYNVRKVSGKPFSNGECVAIVTGVIEHPIIPEWLAFTFKGAKYCHAGQCKPVTIPLFDESIVGSLL